MTSNKEVMKMIRKGESETLEFKERFGTEAIETAVAFTNKRGGTILLGVDNRGKVKGVSAGKETLKDWVNEICQSTEPTLIPEVEQHTVRGKTAVTLTIPESPLKPVAYKATSWIRIKNSNRKLSPKEIAELHIQTTGSSWDAYPAKGANIQDIDDESVRRFVRRAKSERRLGIQKSIPVKESLERLDAMKGSTLTNAAILLFGKNPQKFFSQAEVRCARFKGIEPLEFIDMKVFGKTVIDQREDALEFVKEHITLRAIIKGTERVETWEYPIEAVREAITNAVCHRDYQKPSSVQVRIFDDRLEVWGAGPLPQPLTIEDLTRRHDSVLRNKIIGKCFFLINFIEQWGTGTNRIVEECRSHGLPDPLFEEAAGNMMVTFLKDPLTEDKLRSLGLNSRQVQAVLHVKKTGRITNTEYQSLLNVSKKTASRELTELLKKSVLKRKGKTGKGTYYTLRGHKGVTKGSQKTKERRPRK